MMTKKISFDSSDQESENSNETFDDKNQNTSSKKNRQMKRDCSETYWKFLKHTHQNIKDESLNMYFFCFMNTVDLPTFVKAFDRYVMNSRYRLRTFDTRSEFAHWAFAHKDVLHRTFKHVVGLLSLDDYAYFMWKHSTPCDCYNIEKAKVIQV